MPAEVKVSNPASRRRDLGLWLVGAVVAAAILVGIVVAMGGRLEAATWGLVVAAAAMVFALRSLYRMATVLSRPPVEVVLEQDDVAAYAGQRELREDRRRLLRAINELQFDYEMGKLSHEDYLAVRQGYELQAVEVIRALDAEATLHPQLEAELRRRGLLKDETAKATESVGVEAATGEAADEADEADADEATSGAADDAVDDAADEAVDAPAREEARA